MGHFENKISHFASMLYKKFCLGNPKFINKKAIKAEMANIIIEYITSKYIDSFKYDNDLLCNLIQDINLQMLVNDLKYPLIVMNSQHVDNNHIIVSAQIMDELISFFEKSHKMISRNCQRYVKKSEIKELHEILCKSDKYDDQIAKQIVDTLVVEF